MPGELDEVYREALVRIQKQAASHRELGMRILSWITHAKRPLSVNELRYGLAVEYSDVQEEFDEDNLLSPGILVDVCAGLVIIDSSSQVIRLVHYTTQEYLDKEQPKLFKGVEVDISRACLTYLSCSIGPEVRDKQHGHELIETHPFLDYACHHWFSHANSVLQSEDPDPRLVGTLARFKSSDNITISVKLLWLLSPAECLFWSRLVLDRDKETCPYDVASRLGLEDLLDVLLDRRIGHYPNLDSSLVYASWFGHVNIVELLLQKGAAIDAKIL